MRSRIAFGLIACLACMVLLEPSLALAQTNPFGPAGGRPPPQANGLGAWLLMQQAEFHRAMTGAMRQVAQSPGAIFSLIGLAFAYGVFHAIGPGHGKAIITSYLIANEAALKRGIALSFGAALTQALVALGVVLIVAVMMGGTARTMDDTVNWIEKIGFAIILAMGLSIVWRKTRALFSTHPATCAPDCGHDHGLDAVALTQTRPRDLILTAIGAGIRPCAGAIILLVFALTQKLFWAGAFAVFAMAIGTAIGTSVFALLAVKAKQLALRVASGRATWASRALLAMEALAGLALTLFGLALLIGAMDSGG